MKKKHTPLKIVVLIWLLFSVPYVFYTQYNYLKTQVYQKGLTDAVAQLIQQAQKCEPIPIRLRDQNIAVINVACLTQAQENTDQPEQ